MGDLLLQAVAKRLKTSLRETDFIARLGGDEFAVILSPISRVNEASSVAQKILEILSPEYYLADHKIHISCSIGISYYPQSGTTPEVLIQHADKAMYSAKELGRNNFQLYNVEMDKKKNPL